MGVPALALQREYRRRLRVMRSVLDIIDADRFIWACRGDVGAIRLLHDQRRPTVVVAGLPDDEVTFRSWPAHLRTPANAFSSAGVAVGIVSERLPVY